MLRTFLRRSLTTAAVSSKSFLQHRGIPELSLSSIVNKDIMQQYPQQSKIIAEYTKSLHPGSHLLSKESIREDRFITIMKEFVPLMVLGNREKELKVTEINNLMEVIQLMSLIRIALKIHDTVDEDTLNESSNKKAILIGDFFLILANNITARLEDPELFAFISQCSVSYIQCRFSKHGGKSGFGHLLGCGLLCAHRVTKTELTSQQEAQLRELGIQFGRWVFEPSSKSQFEISAQIRNMDFKNPSAKVYLNTYFLNCK